MISHSNPKKESLKKFFLFFSQFSFFSQKSSQKVSIGLSVGSTAKVNHIILLEIEGGQKFFFVVRTESEKSVFGVEVSELPMVQDVGKENSFIGD
jgi:hypothetical protein